MAEDTDSMVTHVTVTVARVTVTVAQVTVTVTPVMVSPAVSHTGLPKVCLLFSQRKLQEERELVWKDNLDLVQRECHAKVGRWGRSSLY